ncbi:MAG: phytoene/squalene synthase family protein, partial [Ginsengibacter sp.]
YSTSFLWGIYFLSNHLRSAIYSIYGFVRLADEIVDSFQEYDQRSLLQKFKEETWLSISSGISLNPILHSFQHIVHRYNIHHDLIESFLQSMEMDLDKIQYNDTKYGRYIYGSAEAVGLMCLKVFTVGNPEKYETLKPFARRLGAAFQKVNFLRDLKHDYEILGRIYFPDINLQPFTGIEKKQIEKEIEEDFGIALQGIRQLPASSRSGVYLAFMYYKSLFNKIKKLPPQRIMHERVRINNGRKIGLMINSFITRKINWV